MTTSTNVHEAATISDGTSILWVYSHFQWILSVYEGFLYMAAFVPAWQQRQYSGRDPHTLGRGVLT